MTSTTKAFTATLFGAGLALAALSTPVAAQSASPWLNDASHCEIFRALSEVVPGECAQAGDLMVAPPTDLGKTRGWGKTRGIRLKGAPEVVSGPVEGVTTVAVQQAEPPAEKKISARVQFEFDSFELTTDAKAVLDRLAGVLNDELMQDQVVQIEGHADASGSEDYNLTLSQLRARAVRAYLVQQHGVAAERLPFVGKGEAEPLDPSDPYAAVNRRVVFANLSG